MIRLTHNDPGSPVEYSCEIESILHRSQSAFQEIVVAESRGLGRMLVLDGAVQLATADAHFNHEMLAHVALHAHPAPKTVAVIGGGDCATANEVLKHASVEKLYLVEIDEEIIDAAKSFFPEYAAALNDKRTETVFMDGAEFVKAPECRMDVIMVDTADMSGFAQSLYTDDFFRSVFDALNDDGMFVIPVGSLIFHAKAIADVKRTVDALFPASGLYTAPVASWPGGAWTYCVASRKHHPAAACRAFEVKTRYYDAETHARAFLSERNAKGC
ncbi:MAG: polyamine aminopropyltransferase [Nitrospirae bacterium]|nr:polyamine aminopropyltransferase [Nitrospirota bacterium]